MIIPTIHLNGTSKERLIEALGDAYAAINDAQAKLRECAPNGRDYYPQGPDAINKAQDEHRSRQQKLEDVKTDLEKLVEAIDAQGA